ncbi:MAG: asparaginase domain-containing protein [Rubricoccaceae bacterium]|nr:asparaginase domain-containing protein [Rubricoccaceae bacterium]
MDVQIFTTGGTIDKVYFDAQSSFSVGEPQIVEILRTAGASFSFECEHLLQKDSLDLTDTDRRLIASAVAESPAHSIIVTHGTDTMIETAKVVLNALGTDTSKTVVFVGSLTPARFKATDAEFNIGFAAAAVQTLPPGVYVTMNGRVFNPSEVRKNRSLNQFEPLATTRQSDS